MRKNRKYWKGKRRCCIYKLTNLLTGDQYIGQTNQTFQIRMLGHFSSPQGGTEISEAIIKYGKVNFKSEILHDDIPEEDLSDFERYEIANHNSMYPNGYNKTTGGHRNYKYTDEHIQRISEAGKGRVFSEESLKKRSESMKAYYANIPPEERLSAFKGKKHTEEAKRKVSEARTGSKASDETKAKMSKASKGRPKTAEHSANISKGRMGVKFTDEHRKNLSIARKKVEARKRKEKQMAEQNKSMYQQLLFD